MSHETKWRVYSDEEIAAIQKRAKKPCRYDATIVSIYDGDTIRVTISFGFGIKLENVACRLRGINTPEMKQSIAGRAARNFLRDHILENNQHGYSLTIETLDNEQDKYGRILVRLIGRTAAGEEIDFNQALIDNGHAVEYMIESVPFGLPYPSGV